MSDYSHEKYDFSSTLESTSIRSSFFYYLSWLDMLESRSKLYKAGGCRNRLLLRFYLTDFLELRSMR